MPSKRSQPVTARVLSGTNELDISHAALLLKTSRVVAFPTETVYGLGADATNAQAVSRIFTAKRRPADNPLIVHIASAADLYKFNLTPMPLPPLAARLADAFWPGPLTVVLPLSEHARLAPAVTAGQASVAIRVPRHPIAAALLARAGVPIAAPSANLSGRPSPTCAKHVLRDLSDAIDAVVDTSQAIQCGLESTVVDLTGVPTILRPGEIAASDLQKATGVCFRRAAEHVQEGVVPKAPGMKYRHYAPTAPLYIVEGGVEGAVDDCKAAGKRVGVLADLSVCTRLPQVAHVICVPCGDDGSAAGFARALYASLRAFDGEGTNAVAEGVDVILAVPPDDVENGIGEAVMNRLRKAAAGRDEKMPSTF